MARELLAEVVASTFTNADHVIDTAMDAVAVIVRRYLPHLTQTETDCLLYDVRKLALDQLSDELANCGRAIVREFGWQMEDWRNEN
jgi:hypothetical protein